MVTDEEYDNYLDEIYPQVQVASCSYLVSEILKAVDPTAYNSGRADYASMKEEEEEENRGG